ncbi:MAG: phage holin family protein [bacterium]
MKFIFQILTNALAIFLANYLLPNFIFEGDILTLAIAGLVLGLINFFIKPIARLISAPLIILTLGLFIIAINMGILWMLEYLIQELTINGFWTYLWASLIFSAINIIFRNKKQKKD